MRKYATNRYLLEVDDILKIFSTAIVRKEDITKMNSHEKVDLHGNSVNDVRIFHRNIFMILRNHVDLEILDLIKILPHACFMGDKHCHTSNFYISELNSNYHHNDYMGFSTFREFICNHIFFTIDNDIGIIVELEDSKSSYFKMKYL